MLRRAAAVPAALAALFSVSAGAFHSTLPSSALTATSAGGRRTVSNHAGPHNFAGARARRSRRTSGFATTRVSRRASTTMVAAAADATGWEALERSYEASAGTAPASQPPVLTLFRDTNGWCPFCERVWLACAAKGIPFEERLVSLREKDDEFLEMATAAGHPKALVPAIKIAATGEVVFESMDILHYLEEKFPETPLAPKPDSAAAAASQALLDFSGDFLNASSSFVYGRDGEDGEAKKAKFFDALDTLDGLLAASPSGFMSCEESVGLADCVYVPFLERYGYQLPLMASISVRGGPLHARWPNIDRWYAAMEKEPAYANRVAGDEYSWVAVTSTFMRMFNSNGTELNPARARAAANADGKANGLIEQVKQDAPRILADTTPAAKSARLAAAAKILSNHAAIVADATRAEPKSQVEIERAGGAEEVDALLQETVARLLGTEPGGAPGGSSATKSKAAGVIARRLCVPRDMGAAAAMQLRAQLLELEGAYAP